MVVAIDGDVVVAVAERVPEVSLGAGLRLGARVKVALLFVQPEVVVSLQSLSSTSSDGMLIRVF